MKKRGVLGIAFVLASLTLWGQNPENHFPNELDKIVSPIKARPHEGILRQLSGSPQEGMPLNWTPAVDPPDVISEDPGWDLEYEWDSLAGNWRLIKGRTYTYDSQGKLVERRSDDYINGQPSPFYKYMYSYDAQGRLARRSTYYWCSGAWLLTIRISQRLDAHGNRTSQVGQQLFSSTWDTVYADSTRYTYVLGDKIATQEFSFWNDNTRQFENRYRNTWTYNSDSLELTYAQMRWEINQWKPQGMEEQVYGVGGTKLQTRLYIGFQNQWNIWQDFRWLGWHDQSRLLPTAYELDEYAGDSFPTIVQRSRTTLSYGQYDSRRAVQEIYDGQQWTPLMTYSQTKDAMNHNTQFLLFVYSGVDSIFSISSRDHYAYNSQNRVIEEVHERAIMDSTVYQKLSRLEHGDFFMTSIAEPTNEASVSAFPNPCTETLHFNLSATPQEPISIQLYDLQGRMRLQSICPGANSITVPISEALESGTYIYHIATENTTATGKIQIMH